MDSPRPFDPDRFSPIKPDVILRLPEGNARTFWMASTLGRFLRLDGSSDRLQSAKDAAGTLVTAKRRAVILEALVLGLRQWQRLTKDWEVAAWRTGAEGVSCSCSRTRTSASVQRATARSWWRKDQHPRRGGTGAPASDRRDMMRRLNAT